MEENRFWNNRSLFAILLIVHPFVTLLIHPNIIYIGLQQDPAQALGAILNFDFLHNVLMNDRRLDRLPMIFLSYPFYKVFPAMVAHHLLYFISCLGILTLMFFTTRLFAPEPKAMLATLLFATNFWILPTFGDVYLNRYMILFFLAGFYFVVKAARAENQIARPMISGFFAACAFFSHFAALPLLFVGPLYFFVEKIAQKKFSMRETLNFVNYFADGFVVCFLCFGLFNYLFLNGRFLFFINQFAISQADYSDRASGFADVFQPISNSLLLITFVAAIVTLRQQRESSRQRIVAWWFLFAATLYLMLCIANVWLLPKSPIFPRMLIREFFRLWPVPFALLTLYCCLIPEDFRLTPVRLLSLYAALMISISPASSAFVSLTKLAPLLARNTLTIALIGFVIVGFDRYPGNRKWMAGCAFGLALLMRSVLFAAYPVNAANGYADRSYYSRLYRANALLQTPSASRNFYWLNKKPEDVTLWDEYKTIGIFWLCDYNPMVLGGNPFFGPGPAGVTNYVEESMKENSRIILVDEDLDGNAIEQKNPALFPYGMRLREESRQKVSSDDKKYYLIRCRADPYLDFAHWDKSLLAEHTGLTHIANGNFKEGMAGWEGGDSSASWPGKAQYKFATSNYTLSRNPDDRSLLIETSNHLININTHVKNLEVGKLYSFLIRFKIVRTDLLGNKPQSLKAEDSKISDLIYFYDSKGAIPMISPTGSSAKAEWLEDGFAFIAREAESSLWIYCSSDGTYKNSCFIDDVQVKPITANLSGPSEN